MTNKLNQVLLISAICLACSVCNAKIKADYRVIPLPQEVNLTKGKPFTLNKNTVIVYSKHNTLLKRNAKFLAEYIEQSTGYKLKTQPINVQKKGKSTITISLNKSINTYEGYVLEVSSENIQIDGKTENGVFYGIQTLRKAIPASNRRNNSPTCIYNKKSTTF